MRAHMVLTIKNPSQKGDPVHRLRLYNFLSSHSTNLVEQDTGTLLATEIAIDLHSKRKSCQLVWL
jgi:hypothetical protein